MGCVLIGFRLQTHGTSTLVYHALLAGRWTPFIEEDSWVLITTNVWLRRIPYGVCAALFLWMAARVMRTSEQGRAA